MQIALLANVFQSVTFQCVSAAEKSPKTKPFLVVSEHVRTAVVGNKRQHIRKGRATFSALKLKVSKKRQVRLAKRYFRLSLFTAKGSISSPLISKMKIRIKQSTIFPDSEVSGSNRIGNKIQATVND